MIEFGAFQYDTEARLLYRDAEEILLPPRVLAVLESLLKRPGKIVPKDEILNSAWEGAFVGEDSLTQAISQLRQALDDDPQHPTYIQTIPRRGYRLIVQVSEPLRRAEPIELAEAASSESANRAGDSAASSLAIRPGSRLGSYEIVSAIGAGGMGEVNRARDTKLDRDIAIKVLPEDFAADRDRLARFEREAKLLASLNHPNIATIYGLEDFDGVRFIAMELVDGDTLADRLSAQGRIDIEEALEIAGQIAEALEAAHESGVIHRDLKPANVKVTPDERVKVLDFGLAKAFEADGSPSEISPDLSHSPTIAAATRTGVILGTAAYMSPEQARGKAVDRRTDIWGFGCLLYEMLTARKPFDGESVTDVLAAIVKEEPEWTSLPSDTPASVRRLLQRCLRKSPAERLRHIGDAGIEIQEVGADAPESGIEAVSSARRASQRFALLATAAAAFVAGGLLTAALVGVLGGTDSPGPQPSRLEIVPPEGVEVRQNDWNPYIAISPDGSQVVFVGRKEGDNRLYRRDLREGSAAPITGAERGEMPFFSPDGEWIGFIADDKLMKVPAGGGTPQELADADNSFGATWGPDGTIIYAPEAGWGLFRVSEMGGEPAQLTEAEAYWSPSFLHDGRSVLCTRWIGEKKGDVRIGILDLESGEWDELLGPGVAPRYSASGHILFGGDSDLYAVPFDLDSRRISGKAVPVVRGIGNGWEASRQFAVSDTGVIVYLQSEEYPPEELVEVDMNGNSIPLGLQPQMYPTYPRYSPDGTRIAVNVDEVHDSDIWIIELQGRSLRRLTQEGINEFPVWTPDGERVAYLSDRGDENQRRETYWQAADGSDDPKLLYSARANGNEGFWFDGISPDGSVLIGGGAKSMPDFGIAYVRLEEPSEMTLLVTGREGGELHSATFSPDGNWLAYISDESGNEEIYLVPFPGPGATQIISGAADGNARYPHWSPDGPRIYYVQGLPRQMWVAELTMDPMLQVTSRRALFSLRGFVWGSGNYGKSNWDLAPDGQSFLMLKEVGEYTPPQHIGVIVNFFEELKRLVPTGGS